jgi:acyl-CoA dehydrogenase
MTSVDPLLSETAARIFADLADFTAVERAERDGWAPDLWVAIADAGLPWVSVPEAAGGSGGTLADAVEIVRVAGRHAVPLPLAETGLLAGWLLSTAHLDLPAGPLTMVPRTPTDTTTYDGTVLHGRADRVPWARAVDAIVLLLETPSGCVVAVVDRADVRVEHATNLAGEPRDTVLLDGVVPLASAPAAEGVDVAAARRRGALARAAAMAGALERLQELTTEYAFARVQFGRAIASFQAVQAHLVHLAQQRVLAELAVLAAVHAATRGDAPVEIAAAKLVADRAATEATRHAHQVHGAMGMTREYPLHHLTRRLWSWRSEYGNERTWSRVLGETVHQVGADHLYRLITDGSDCGALQHLSSSGHT